MTQEPGRRDPEAGAAIDTLVIGGSQAGLACSYHLTQQGRPHLVLEQDRIGASWIAKRWDSFTLVTPNWMNRLPGFPYQGEDPDGYLPRPAIVAYLEDYSASFGAPLRLGVRALRLRPRAGGAGYRLETNTGPYEARNVIVATGFFQHAKVPDFAGEISAAVQQIHSSAYRNPARLRAGAVLVVGSGQSGCQIAQELHEQGRRVYLSVSSAGRIPRRYRGMDVDAWLVAMGRFDKSFEDPANPVERYRSNPHVSGRNGGQAINLRSFARDGILLLGRVVDAAGDRLFLAPGLNKNVAKADAVSIEVRTAIDDHIGAAGLDVPPSDDQNGDDGGPSDGPALPELPALDLAQAGITTIVWATGYGCDFSWVDLPLRDGRGYPIQRRGVTDFPGLYFCGLHWMHSLKSGLFYGVGDGAQHVTKHLANNRSPHDAGAGQTRGHAA